MSLLTRINTCVLVASVLLIRATPGKFLSMIHNRSGVNTWVCSSKARSSNRCSASALSPPDGPDTTARGAAGEGVGEVQAPDLRVAGVGLPGRAERVPVRLRVGHPGHGPVDGAQPQSATHIHPVAVAAVPAVAVAEFSAVVVAVSAVVVAVSAVVAVLGVDRGQQPLLQLLE